jgi:hypothetical protein
VTRNLHDCHAVIGMRRVIGLEAKNSLTFESSED